MRRSCRSVMPIRRAGASSGRAAEDAWPRGGAALRCLALGGGARHRADPGLPAAARGLDAVTSEVVAGLYSADRNYLLVELRRFTLGDALRVLPLPGLRRRGRGHRGSFGPSRFAGSTAMCSRRPSFVELEDGYQDRDGKRASGAPPPAATRRRRGVCGRDRRAGPSACTRRPCAPVHRVVRHAPPRRPSKPTGSRYCAISRWGIAGGSTARSIPRRPE